LAIISQKNTIRSFGLWAFTPLIPLCPKPKTENLILLYLFYKKKPEGNE
jgi:hypothetical protein